MRRMRFATVCIVFSMAMLAGLPVLRAQAGVAPGGEAGQGGEEQVLHEGKWMRTIESDLIAGKFDELDRMAEEYRRDKTRLPGGDWRLRIFYSALDAPQQTDKDSLDHVGHLEDWMKARPESITARVALATSLHRWAWVARGSGLANTVTPEGWRLFDERMKESQVVLEGSGNMSRMCPQWYSEMMTVGLAQSWDDHRVKDTFERGVQFEPDYFYLYLQYANYLLPKWDGHPGDAAKFAKESADHLGGDSGDLLYFQIATVLIKRGDGNFPVKQMDWQRIQKGAQALQGKYGATRRTTNELAYMAYMYRDAVVARQQFSQIGDDWSRGVWRDRKYFDRARDWAQGQPG
jgi:Domain of unknown function (DUF4034)